MEKQDTVLQRTRKQYYGEAGNSIVGCPIEPEKHEKDPPPPQPSYPRVLYANFPLTFMLKT